MSIFPMNNFKIILATPKFIDKLSLTEIGDCDLIATRVGAGWHISKNKFTGFCGCISEDELGRILKDNAVMSIQGEEIK